MTLIVMLPVAESTPSSDAICASFPAEIDCWPGLVITRERLNFCPCLDWSGGCMPNAAAPLWSIFCCWETVMSVPTPYSDCSTWSWALPTPAA